MKELKNQFERLPKHLAIILDGNGRWASSRNLPRNLGHRKGAFNLKDITLECSKLGIAYLTVYAFSTENWSRPEKEVKYLFNQPLKYFNKYFKRIGSTDIRFKFIGRRDRFSKEFLDCVLALEEATKENLGLTLTIACDYGSYEELTMVTKKIAEEVLAGKLNVADITEEAIHRRLYTAGYPKLDLLIRTSGELRLSNFLLWQAAYAEFYFTNVFWPDFNANELHKALKDFASRKRRFGGLKEEKK